jgi:hypothetical protein
MLLFSIGKRGVSQISCEEALSSYSSSRKARITFFDGDFTSVLTDCEVSWVPLERWIGYSSTPLFPLEA